MLSLFHDKFQIIIEMIKFKTAIDWQKYGQWNVATLDKVTDRDFTYLFSKSVL
jgi:hypothetical protein